MPLIAWSGLERHYGTQEVLRGASGALERGEKVALVGPNGCGKTTLLKILAGRDRPDTGTVSLARGASVGYLPQRPEPPPGKSLHDWVMEAFEGLRGIERELDAVHDALATAEGEEQARLVERQGELQHELERRGGWDTERRASAILRGLGFREDQLGNEAAVMSGGEKSRGALARILCEEPELILRDEPTNHLDLDMLEWLEGWLREAHEAVIVVSHDRYFLDRVAERVFAMDRGRIVEYVGNYSRYVELRAERRTRALKERAEFQAYVEKQREFIRRFKAGQRAKEAAGREKRLEREIEEMGEGPLVEQVGGGRMDAFGFGEIERSGHEVLRVKGLAHRFEGAPKSLFERLDLEIIRQDRLGVIGPNGSGKTTFLKIAAGEIAAQMGELKRGANLALGYYRQEGEDLDPEKSALEDVHDAAPSLDTVKIRGVLGRFGLTDDEQLKKSASLSGGERARVTLAKLFLKRANLLVLDEPTNHLDLEAREALESALDEYDGTVVAVSHDRYFLDRTARRILAFGHGSVPRAFAGNYTDYKAKWAAEQRAARAAGSPAPARPATPAPPKKPAPAAQKPAKVKRKHTFEQLEGLIVAAEARLKAIESSMQSPGNSRDFGKLKQLSAEYEVKRKELAALNAEWEAWAGEM